MTIYFQVKSLGKNLRQTEPVPFSYAQTPTTLRALICETARICAEAYNARLEHRTGHTVLSSTDLEAMASVGKIAFGAIYSDAKADPDRASQAAISGFEDGLFRVFVNDTEITEPDHPLALRENDQITIIRLVMLTGGFF